MSKKCKTCRQSFYVIPSLIKKGKGIYCSIVCYNQTKRGSKVGKSNPAWKGERKQVLCVTCQNPIWAYPHELQRRRKKFCSRSCCAQWQSLHRRGELAGGWRNGKTNLYRQIRSSLQYKTWRESCLKRDQWTCQSCGQKGGRLEVDHIIPFALLVKQNEITTTIQAFECIDLWDMKNGRTLCLSCHQQTDTYMTGTKYLYL